MSRGTLAGLSGRNDVANILMIDQLSLETIVRSFVSHNTGTVTLVVASLCDAEYTSHR